MQKMQKRKAPKCFSLCWLPWKQGRVDPVTGHLGNSVDAGQKGVCGLFHVMYAENIWLVFTLNGLERLAGMAGPGNALEFVWR